MRLRNAGPFVQVSIISNELGLSRLMHRLGNAPFLRLQKKPDYKCCRRHHHHPSLFLPQLDFGSPHTYRIG